MQFMTQSHQPFDISSCLFFKPLWAFPCSTHLPEALDLALSTCRIQMRVRWSSTCIKINQDMIPHLLPHGLFEHISNRSPAWSCMQLACGIRARCLWPTQWEVDRSCGKPYPNSTNVVSGHVAYIQGTLDHSSGGSPGIINENSRISVWFNQWTSCFVIETIETWNMRIEPSMNQASF